MEQMTVAVVSAVEHKYWRVFWRDLKVVEVVAVRGPPSWGVLVGRRRIVPVCRMWFEEWRGTGEQVGSM